MKKLLAVVLSIIMLFSLFTLNTIAEEATPSVTIITNQGSPVAKGVTTRFTVRFDDFSIIKGVDVTISADQNIVLGKVEAIGFKSAAAENVNFTEDNTGSTHVIRFVDLTAAENARIVFDAYVPTDAVTTGDPSISVTGKYAKDGKTLFEIEAPANGAFELTKPIDSVVQEEATTTPAVNPETDTTFIPYGGVFTGEGDNFEYVPKNTDGSFNIPEGATVQTYAVPKNGITTFGASDDLTDNGNLKFGTYSKLAGANVSHGTLVFEGDWLKVKNFYIHKGYTVQDIVEAFYKSYEAAIQRNPNATHVYYTIDGAKINVYNFKQTKYMWKSGNVLEYAVRLHGTKPNTVYTAVAYSKSGETVTFSQNVKSVQK